MANKVYVVEVKNCQHDWHPQEVYLDRDPAERSVDKKKHFCAINKILKVRSRVKTYVPMVKGKK